jgi:asparagine synthase (glutamine-hydrolysing)
MDYLAFRYTKTKYRVPIDYNNKVKRVDPDEIEKRLEGKEYPIFLSGGVDSSLLAAIRKPSVAYVGYFDNFNFKHNEHLWAIRVANLLGIEIKGIVIKRDRYLSTVEHLIRHKGDGLHPTEPCFYLMAQQAKRDGFDTILSGEGADGLFGGYTDLLMHEDVYMRDKETFLNRYALANKDVDIPFKKWKKWGMYRFLLEFHTPGLIDRAVSSCSAAGVDVVFPYLENDLPQLMWEAPMGQKIGKPLLKEIALDYLPKDIIYRKKIGFPTPWDVKEFLRLNKEIGWT